MVSIEDAIIARLDSQGESFEVLIDSDVAKELREGNEVDISDHMAIEEIFRDAKKGDRPPRRRPWRCLGRQMSWRSPERLY